MILTDSDVNDELGGLGENQSESDQQEKNATTGSENDTQDKSSHNETSHNGQQDAHEQQHGSNLPITDLSFVLDEAIVEKHLDGLSSEEIKQLYQDSLPKSVNANKYEILQTIKSPYFQQSLKSLSDSLRQCNGAGYLISQSLKYDYKGEGIDGFLQGIRQLSKKEN